MSEWMTIKVPSGDFRAYVARPKKVSAPSVVVLQEVFGVNKDIQLTCDELAARGFIAVSPDLYWRQEPGLDLNTWSDAEWKKGLDLYGAYDRDQGVLDIAATLQAAGALHGASGKVGVMGFCLGGLMTFLAAARLRVDAAVAYHGGETEKYLGEASRITAPMIMHLGDQDEFIPADAQAKIRAALNRKPNVVVYAYPGCKHAFARHNGTHYAADAAATANERTRKFLADSLG